MSLAVKVQPPPIPQSRARLESGEVDLRVVTVERLLMVLDAVDWRNGLCIEPWFEVQRHKAIPEAYTIRVWLAVLERDSGADVEIHQDLTVILPETFWVILDRVRRTIEDMVAHELRESMHYAGLRLFDPHTIPVK